MSPGINFEDRLLRELHEQLADQPMTAVARPTPRRPVRRWVLAGGLSAAAVATVAVLPLLTRPGPAYAISKQPDGSFIVVLHSRTAPDIDRVEREMKQRGVRVEMVALGAQCGTGGRGVSPPHLPDGLPPGILRKDAPVGTGGRPVSPTGVPSGSSPPAATGLSAAVPLVPALPPASRPSGRPTRLPPSPPLDHRPPPEWQAFTPLRLPDGEGDDLAFRVNPAAFPAGQVLWVAVFDRAAPPVTGPTKFLASEFADVGKPAPDLC